MTGNGFIPYGRQDVTESDIEAVVTVLRSDFLTQGPAVEAFEEELIRLTGARFCVSFSNATAALHASVASLQLEEGSEGITTPNTFVASANCLVYNRLKPCFADIDPLYFNLSPSQTETRISSKTKVLIPVHFAGRPADMVAFAELASQHRLRVIEDASHAIGSYYPDGSPVGCCQYSDATVFSFHPVKTVTTGEGGAVTTNDPILAQRLRLFRSHGIERNPGALTHNPGPWYHEMVDLGFNYRLTDIQAALGTSQLQRLAATRDRRRVIAERYNSALNDLPGLQVPREFPGAQSCLHLYVIRIDFNLIKLDRAAVMSQLKKLGVGTQVHYIPVHTQPYYQNRWGYGWGDFPVAEAYYSQALSLPLFPKMTDEDVEQVIAAVRTVLS